MSDTYSNPENDPTLTAYALGELDSQDVAAVEARLAGDPLAAAHVEGVRRDAAALASALKSEAEPAMRVERRRRLWPVALAAAATLAAVGLTTWALLPTVNYGYPAKEVAVNAPPQTQPSPPSLQEQREVERGAIKSQFDQAMAATEAAAAQTDFAKARASLQRATAARQANPQQFANSELAEFDRQIGEAQRELDATQATNERVVAQADHRSAAEQSRQRPAGEASRQHPDAGAARAAPPVATASDAESGGGGFGGGGLGGGGLGGGGLGGGGGGFGGGGGGGGGGGFGGGGGVPAEVPARRAKVEALSDTLGPGRYRQDFDTEAYDGITDNGFRRVADHPLSTFSVDVDTASYSNVRRFLDDGRLPPPDAVRIEEMVNYFDYAYAPPADDNDAPFAARVEVASVPWAPTHRLVRIGIKGKEVSAADRKASNLVFLLDVSGSMQDANKLPLVQASMRLLLDKLDRRDRVAIVVYAGSSGLVLPSTSANDKEAIRRAIDNLSAGGSTNGAQGIELAYQTADSGFIKDGVNRVILCTDGDFNIGVTDRGSLTRLVEEKAKSGVYLTLLGFGMGNLKDATMEELSNKGEGNYAYVDTEAEARKVLVEQMAGTLQAIAKDVKLQVEFNPAEVGSYRLIGYENRVLAKEDFNDDKKDAGDIGAGHEVTALYEVVPLSAAAEDVAARVKQLEADIARLQEAQKVESLDEMTRVKLSSRIVMNRAFVDAIKKLPEATPKVDDLKYQRKPATATAASTGELLTLKLRYKQPDAPKEQGTSTLIEFPVKDAGKTFEQADADFQFAAEVAGFGMLLRDSPYKGSLTWAGLEAMAVPPDIAAESTYVSPEAERRIEFCRLVRKAAQLAPAAGR